MNRSPSRVLSAGLGLASMVAACGGAGPVLRPTEGPPPAPPVVVSGVVYEHGPFGPRPLGGIDLYAASDRQGAPAATSDANGRYRFTAPAGTDLTLLAEIGTYRQPCRARAFLATDTPLDVHVVSRATLTTSGMPPSLPIVGPRVSGRVFDVSDGSDRPVAGASISGTFGDAWHWGPSVFTLTDTAGRYVLCGPGDSVEIVAFVDRLVGNDRTTINLVETGDATWDFRLFSLD